MREIGRDLDEQKGATGNATSQFAVRASRLDGTNGATSSGTATIGTHPAAREDALRRVPEFLARKLPTR